MSTKSFNQVTHSRAFNIQLFKAVMEDTRLGPIKE